MMFLDEEVTSLCDVSAGGGNASLRTTCLAEGMACLYDVLGTVVTPLRCAWQKE